jgi:hypothetical protein
MRTLDCFNLEGISICTQSSVNFPTPILSKNKPVLLLVSGEFGKDALKILKAMSYPIQGFIKTSPIAACNL